MKTIFIYLFLVGGFLSTALAQKNDNFISASVDGEEWKAESKSLKIPIREKDFNYLALVGFKVHPDEQLWLRLYYFADSLQPGTQ